ncbi:MAG: acyl-CoA thioesterase [Maioricimonas sp. JB049]
MQIRVRYSETDAMGFLHHANYAIYFEMGRTELYRASGGDYRAMEERGFFLVVVQLECRFKRPARYDDVLTLKTRLARRSPAKLEHEYELWRDSELLTTGRSVLACVDRDGKVQPMTDERLFGAAG